MSYVKQCKSKFEYDNEKYALQELKGTGIAPEIISFCPSSKEIEMTRVTIPQLNLDEVYEAGDESIIKYAKAEYEVRKILDEKGVAYHDWKNEHQFYDTTSGKLVIIDFGGDESKTEKGLYKEQLDDRFSFLKDPNYTQNDRYIEYKKEIEQDRFFV